MNTRPLEAIIIVISNMYSSSNRPADAAYQRAIGTAHHVGRGRADSSQWLALAPHAMNISCGLTSMYPPRQEAKFQKNKQNNEHGNEQPHLHPHKPVIVQPLNELLGRDVNVSI